MSLSTRSNGSCVSEVDNRMEKSCERQDMITFDKAFKHFAPHTIISLPLSIHNLIKEQIQNKWYYQVNKYRKQNPSHTNSTLPTSLCQSLVQNWILTSLPTVKKEVDENFRLSENNLKVAVASITVDSDIDEEADEDS